MTLNRSSCTGRVLSVLSSFSGETFAFPLISTQCSISNYHPKNQWLTRRNFRNSRRYMALYHNETSLHNRLYMLDCWQWDLVDFLSYEEDKMAGNARDRGEKQGRARVRAGNFEPALAVQGLLKSADGAGLHRADSAQEAQVAVAALQASAQG